MELITETYKSEISCVLSCFDRLILTGTMPEISYGQGMTKYMFDKGVKIFDYPKFAEPFKEIIRANAERIAKEHGVEIEFIRKTGVRKESIISEKILNMLLILAWSILSQSYRYTIPIYRGITKKRGKQFRPTASIFLNH